MSANQRASHVIAGAALVFAALALSENAAAQWSSEQVEIVYRDGRRSNVRASPFLGIFAQEIRLGQGGTIRRADVRFFCFKACPASLPSAPVAEDTVVWADGTTTTGPVWVGGEYDGHVVRQAGKATSRRGAQYIQFKEAQ